jgi:hypothetical protein
MEWGRPVKPKTKWWKRWKNLLKQRFLEALRL